jgi:hypothetical protein
MPHIAFDKPHTYCSSLIYYLSDPWIPRFSESTSTTAMGDTGPDSAPAPAPKGILLKADTVAEPFLAEVKASLANSTSRSRPPKLVGILATTNAPSRSYAEFTRKQCVGLGIEFELREVGAALGGRDAGADGASTSNGDGVEEAIIEANADDTVDGIMVRAPIVHIPSSKTFHAHDRWHSPRCIIQFLARSR